MATYLASTSPNCQTCSNISAISTVHCSLRHGGLGLAPLVLITKAGGVGVYLLQQGTGSPESNTHTDFNSPPPKPSGAFWSGFRSRGLWAQISGIRQAHRAFKDKALAEDRQKVQFLHFIANGRHGKYVITEHIKVP